VFKATEQITKYTERCQFGDNEEICVQNGGKSISEHLKSKFSRGSMPPKAWATPFGCVKFYPLGVTPVTTTAMVVQNSIENPDYYYYYYYYFYNIIYLVSLFECILQRSSK